MGFKLRAIPSGVMKSRTIPLCPALDVNQPSVQGTRVVSHFAGLSRIRWVLMVLLVTRILLDDGPEAHA